ncbi:MAG: 2,3-bisphosphoglycerate-independent phosphoglycerate mutase [Planctomycetota bacterium]
MKYVIVIADGAADFPVDALGGLTPLRAAATPHLDKLARAGRVGTARTTPPGFGAGSDVCSMSLLGYDPEVYHTGRAPLEAAAMGIDTNASDWILRVNLVSVTGEPGVVDGNGVMIDHAGGAIPSDEARALFDDLAAHWRAVAPGLNEGISLSHGVEYRGVAVDQSGRSYEGVESAPPHEVPGEPWAEHLPDGGRGDAAARLCELIGLSHVFLSGHPINVARVEQGLRPANMAWIWGQGTAAKLPSFDDRFGLRGAMTTSVDLLRGLALLMGWEVLDVPGAAGTHADNDYAAQAEATIDALETFDVVCCHVESPDEAAHQADWETKVTAIEAIDREVVGPVLNALARYGDPEATPGAEGWRLLVLPDHYTRCDTRRHDPTPVPFAMGGAWVRSVVSRVLTEADATASDVHVDPGHDLMEYFLRSGLRVS